MNITGTAYNSEHAQRGIKYTTSQTLSNFSVNISMSTNGHGGYFSMCY